VVVVVVVVVPDFLSSQPIEAAAPIKKVPAHSHRMGSRIGVSKKDASQCDGRAAAP
jgi:hypothetical protein